MIMTSKEVALLRFLVSYEVQNSMPAWVPLPEFICQMLANRAFNRALDTMQAIKRDSPERYAELLEGIK